MARTPSSTAVAAVLLALALSGCGDDGDRSADDAPATASSSTAPSTEAAASSGAAPSSGSAPAGSASPSSGAAPSNEPSGGSSVATGGPARGPVRLTDGVWTLSDVAVERRAGGDVVVTARVANGGPRAHTGFFALRIYTPGSQIAELRGSADLGPGGTTVVTFSGEVPEGGLPGDPATYTYEFLVEQTL